MEKIKTACFNFLTRRRTALIQQKSAFPYTTLSLIRLSAFY